MNASVDESRVARLCPAPRRIVDLEVRAGNWIDESWEGWGFVILLGAPFLVPHTSSDGHELEYRDLDDSHQWKSEYHCKTHDQLVACRFPR